MKPVCLVTGAGGRLGRDLCALLRDSHQVVATYRHTPPALGGGGAPVHLIQADLARSDQLQRLVDTALERHGRVDALVNGAADIGFHGSLRDLWRAGDYPHTQLHLNAVVPMLLASALYQACWKDRGADNAHWNRSVVNVSSISGLYVMQERGQAWYGVSKAALNMLTLYLSLELAGAGVRVNAVCPSRFSGAAATRRVSHAVRDLLAGDATGTIVSGLP